ncbi:AAA family ATPase [Nocardia sp. NPDC020380]|uniref:helix-turn-helix transcriptional regulator n=1 Tax=Nocardia sp. NPDC020380 TaxID=3364309 RepID=UPI0037AE1C19
MVSFPGSSALVGRGADLAVLVDAVDARQTHTVLVAGEAGIGKSRLVGEFTGRLDPKTPVLIGRCPEFGTGGVAFAPFLAVLRGLIRQLGVEGVAALLPPRPALSNWLPQLAVHTGGAAVDADRLRLFGEILTLLEQLAATGPVVLILEDLHWADEASRELLTFLVANLTAGEVLLVCTYRPGDAGPLRGLVAELRRDPGVQVLDLQPLTRHEVGRQLAAILGREPESMLITKVHERSGGNPLFVEALGQAPEAAPADLTDLLLGFQNGLSADARTVLRVGAVIGAPIRHDLLDAAVDLPPDALHPALRDLVDRRLLLTTDTGYEFRHVLIRQAIYDDLLPAERVRIHAHLVEVLAAQPDSSPADLAHHAAAAGDLPLALSSYWQAAPAVPAAHPERLRLLDQVLDLWDHTPEPDRIIGTTKLALLEQIVETAMASGAIERGIAAATAALALAGYLDSPPAGPHAPAPTSASGDIESQRMSEAVGPVRSGSTSRAGGFGAGDGDVVPSAGGGGASATPDAVELERVARLYRQRGFLRSSTGAGPGTDLARALELLPEGEVSLERGETLVQAAQVRIFGGDTAGTARLAGAALEVGEQLGAGAVVARASAMLGLVAADRIDTARDHFTRAHAAAAAGGDARVLLDVVTWESAVLHGAGRYREAIAVIQQGLRAAHESFRFTEAAPILLVKWTQSLAALGRWGEARAVVDETQFDQLPPLSRAALLLSYANISVAQGNPESAEREATVAEHLLGDSRWAQQYRLQLYALRSLLALDQGDARGAAAVLGVVDALDGMAATLLAHPHEAWPLVVLAARTPGAPAGLLALAESLSQASPVDVAQHAVFAAYREDSVAHWKTAAAAWRELEQPFDEARCLLAAAESAVAVRDRNNAATDLRAAMEIAVRLGAEPLAEAAAQFGARAGILKEDPAREDPKPQGNGELRTYGLTTREREVLGLVAKGLSNRGLASELFISVNTAGVHVSRILTKLGVASRTEAAAFARDHGLV